MEKTRKSTKVLSVLMAVVMLLGVIAVGMTASATDYSGPGQTDGYTMGDTVIVNGHKYECQGWWVTTEPPGASWVDMGPVSSGGDQGGSTVPVPDEVTIKVIPSGSPKRDYMGYGDLNMVIHSATAPDVDTLRNYAPCSSFKVKKGEQYVMYMTAQIQGSWYIGTKNDDCVCLKLTDKGLDYYGAGYGWSTINAAGANNYDVKLAGKTSVEVRYAPGTPNGTVIWTDIKEETGTGGGDPVPDDVDPYVSDTTLETWAKLNHDLALTADGADRQAFSVNSVKNLLAGFGAAPARTVAKEFKDPATQAYYKQCKVDNAKYMKHEQYQYSEYFLHDFYAQGVWDAMPATYGWMQDEYTTPGKVVMTIHPEVQGLAYAIALGGQNPYILCNYIARNASIPGEDGSFENASKGNGNADGWFYGYDEEVDSAYLWNPTEGIFLSYEDKKSWEARAKYINDEGLAGVILWEISGDDKVAYSQTRVAKDMLRDKGKQVIAYFCNWSVYNDYHQRQTPKDLPWDALTIVNYSFFQIGGYDTGTKDTPATPYNDKKVHTIDAWADDYSANDGGDTAPNMLLEMKEQAAAHPDVKIMFSIGGWTRGDGFAAAVENASSRKELIDSIIAFIDQYPFFSGVDLDWEYPAVGSRDPDFDDCADMGCPNSSNDAVNFPTFVRELRTALDAKYGAGKKMITSCFNGAPEKLAKLGQPAITSLTKDLNYFNMMTYDYHGAFDPTIGYNNLLGAHKATPNEWCTKNTVNALVGYGVPKSKINIGAGLYSRGWAGVIPDENMNPAPLGDKTPIFGKGGDVVDPPVDETDDKMIIMKKDMTVAYVDGAILPTTDYGNGIFAKCMNMNGTYALPLRYIGENFGMAVEYINGQTRITNKNGEYVIIQKGNAFMNKYNANNQVIATFTAPLAPFTDNGVTMVPLRTVSEALGLGVCYVSSSTTGFGSYVAISTDKSIDQKLDTVYAEIGKAHSMGL